MRALALLLAVAAAAFLAADEMTSSRMQARHFSERVRQLTFHVGDGPSGDIRFPGAGPFDERLGYSRLPALLERLTARGYVIDAQARLSPALLDLAERGYFPPYREKSQAGLEILDCKGEPIFHARYPQRVYPSFEAIPPVVVEALLFIENRELLDTNHPTRNPAIDWTRLGMAVASQAMRLFGADNAVPGGSTLATQIEKYRHSPEGITNSPSEKLRQMVSASLRAYRHGEDTVAARQQIVLDYLNTVPLSALPGYGEVNGIGDGLWVWYGAELDEFNRLLRTRTPGPEAAAAQGLAFRQVLSLMIAHRRPSHYLFEGRAQLAASTDRYLRLLADTGVISAELRDAALSSKARFRDPERDSPPVSIDADKSTSIVRARLSAMLGVPLYSLDRMDLTASSTLERGVQEAVGTALRELTDPGRAEEAGLIGERLLAGGDPRRVSYSLTLVERGEDANRVRIQTDNLNQPLDLNEGSKLELGSTAKLRTLATYLEIVVELHGRLAGLKPEELRGLDIDRRDNLTRWAADYLRQAEDTGLAPMLEAAMQRRYSAHPGEAFFTGGGLHTFENFKREDDPRRPTVYEALRDSINLAFIRMMRDIVRYYVYQPGSTTRVLEDPELRASYLAQFAEREGKVFVQRFYRKYRDKPPEAVLPSLLAGVRPTAERLAVVFRAIEPDAGFDRFREFVLDHLNERTGGALPADSRLMHLYDRHAPGRFSLADQGYLARVHPLELWLAGYLRSHPGASLAEVIEASRAERQVVYGWLFKTRHRAAQDRRIQSLLEIEAFLEIHRQWKRLGYPFEQLVPSYATAIGSSGDRPAALAELMGIILNDGRRLPMVRVESLRFGGETPYETRMRHVTSRPEQVMAPEVAATLRRALTQVVSAGTARRLHGAFDRTDGPRIAIGGKTGTGDNRIESYGPGGRVIASRVLNRTATFVFFVGDRHFGTLTAFVAGREADAYQFTSALPVQILKALAPQLASFLDPRRPARCAPADRAVIAHIRQEHATSAR